MLYRIERRRDDSSDHAVFIDCRTEEVLHVGEIGYGRWCDVTPESWDAGELGDLEDLCGAESLDADTPAAERRAEYYGELVGSWLVSIDDDFRVVRP